MGKYSRFLILLVLTGFLGWLILHRPAEVVYFRSFDETQIQDHYSPKELIYFYQRLRKKKWRRLNKLYKTHLYGRTKRRINERIPKIIHQIWLGSPLPERCKVLQKSWIKHHPEWEYHLWTEKDIEHLYLQNRPLFEAAKNPAEKSDILRYEILYQFGGVYIDTDFECLKPFDILNENCDLYAGLDDHIRSPFICNGLIGSIPGHPFIKKCIQNLRTKKPALNIEDIHANTGPVFFTQTFFDSTKKIDKLANVIMPSTFFYPIPREKRGITDPTPWIQDNTFAIHHWHYSYKD